MDLMGEMEPALGAASEHPTSPETKFGVLQDVTDHNHVRVAELFRALAEPNRLSIIHCLAGAPHRVGEIAVHVGLAQSTVSAHLAVLREAGIVTARPDGRSTWYRLDNDSLEFVLDAAERLVARSELVPVDTSAIAAAERALGSAQ